MKPNDAGGLASSERTPIGTEGVQRRFTSRTQVRGVPRTPYAADDRSRAQRAHRSPTHQLNG
jgi:hypothetical protein